MVRYKKRYFVLQLDRHTDVLNQLQQSNENISSEKKKKKKIKVQTVKKRSLCDPNPLRFNDGHLSNAIKDIVLQIHGDFGRAAVTMGEL